MAERATTVAVAGAGYFASYHLDAWSRLDGVRLCAVADPDAIRRELAADRHGIGTYVGVEEMLDRERPDVIDIVTPPSTHQEIAMLAATRGIHVICQKPVAPTTAEATTLVDAVAGTGVRFMVHENWRWQPWYRTMRRLFDDGVAGEPFSAMFTLRTGDGWMSDAYLDRQPYFRDYPRLLLFETGVHFVDTFRFLFGEVRSVYAQTRRHNPEIAGEDAALCVLTFESGTIATLDASRYNAPPGGAPDPRYTFGTMRIDTSRGHVILEPDGLVTWTELGRGPVPVGERPPTDGFAGDSVAALHRHFLDALRSGDPFESEAADYLRTIEVVDACYESARSGSAISLTPRGNRGIADG